MVNYSASGPSRPHRRPISASEVRAVVFTTTRMRLGYDVEEVDAFLDQVEWSMEQAAGQIARLQQQLADIDRVHSDSLAQARLTAQNLLALLGGAPGSAGLAATPVRPDFAGSGQQPRRAAYATPPAWSGTAPPSPPPGHPAVRTSPPPTGTPVTGLPAPKLAVSTTTAPAVPLGPARPTTGSSPAPPTGEPVADLPPPGEADAS